MAEIKTQVHIGELYDLGGKLAHELDNLLQTTDGNRIIDKIFLGMGIDTQQRDLQILVPTSSLQQLTEEVNRRKKILESDAIKNRNILQAIYTARAKGASDAAIDSVLSKSGFERIQFQDPDMSIGLVASRKIIDGLSFLVKEPAFGYWMGRYGAQTTVLKEAKHLAMITSDIPTYLRFASGLTPNYFNNCWATSALLYEEKLEQIAGIVHHSSDIVWSDKIGVRPTIDEYGYTVGLFDGPMFELLKYFKRSPKMYELLKKKINGNKKLEQLLEGRSKENLSRVAQISTSVPVHGLRLKQGEDVFQYFVENQTVVSYLLDAVWNPLANTKKEVAELSESGVKINDVIYNAETSVLAIDWYEQELTGFGRFFDSVNPFRILGRYIERKARRQYNDEVLGQIAEERAELIAMKHRIETARLEQLVALRTEELRKAEDEKRIAMERAMTAQRLESLVTLAAGLAHTVNSQIAPADGILELIKMDLDTPTIPQQERIQLLDYIGAFERIIDDIKGTISGFRSITKGTDKYSQNNINDICTAAQNMLSFTLNKITYEQKNVFGEDVAEVYCNKGEIAEVMVNLYRNAIEAMSSCDQRILTTRTYQKNDYVFIEVKDTGSGIPEEIIHRIFEPLFTTKKLGEGSGMGLGLNICYRTITAHKGEITAQNYNDGEKKGARFIIQLPIDGGMKNGTEG